MSTYSIKSTFRRAVLVLATVSATAGFAGERTARVPARAKGELTLRKAESPIGEALEVYFKASEEPAAVLGRQVKSTVASAETVVLASSH
jgi:hypothetical protein